MSISRRVVSAVSGLLESRCEQSTITRGGSWCILGCLGKTPSDPINNCFLRLYRGIQRNWDSSTKITLWGNYDYLFLSVNPTKTQWSSRNASDYAQ